MSGTICATNPHLGVQVDLTGSAKDRSVHNEPHPRFGLRVMTRGVICRTRVADRTGVIPGLDRPGRSVLSHVDRVG